LRHFIDGAPDCHESFQEFVTSCFMQTDLADLRGMWVDLGKLGSIACDLVAAFTASSVISLPMMSLCPGTHMISVLI